MSARVLFVSVNNTFKPGMDLAALETCVATGWALTVAKAKSCDRVVAKYGQHAIGAWRLRDVYPLPDDTYKTTGGDRARVGLSIGEALPVLPDYNRGEVTLRRGSATYELDDVEPLPPASKVVQAVLS